MYYTYFYNYRRSRLRRLLWPALGIILLLAVLFRLSGYLAAGVLAEAPGKHGFLYSLINWTQRDSSSILRAGIPLLAWVGDESVSPLASPSRMAKPLVGMFTLDKQRPLHMLQSQMPLMEADAMLSGTESISVTAQEPGVVPLPDDEEEEESSPVAFLEESLVAVYFTHTGETYALTDGMERLHGKKGGVVKVGEALRRELEDNYGVRVALSDKINDADYGASYVQSQETLRELLEDNPSVQVVLDIHRDAGKSRENSLVTVHGQEVAPVLIVVGSDARAPFPTWRENYDFARELAAEIEKQHPGLCLGVQIKEGRYNQFLHPRAVLLEVGSVSNSTEEAVQTGRLLAGPVAELIKRYLDGNTESSAL